MTLAIDKLYAATIVVRIVRVLLMTAATSRTLDLFHGCMYTVHVHVHVSII